MEKSIKEITLLRTKAGKGFKCVVDGEWFYTSSGEMLRMLQKNIPCKLRSMTQHELKQAVLPCTNPEVRACDIQSNAVVLSEEKQKLLVELDAISNKNELSL